jgi:hypothetical protein
VTNPPRTFAVNAQKMLVGLLTINHCLPDAEFGNCLPMKIKIERG